MFKEKVMIWVLAIMLVGVGLAVAKEATEGTQTAELKLIMEYKFDEPVVDVIFGEATMTVKEAKALGVKGLGKRSVKEIVKVQYPKVLVTEKAVKFLDERGSATSEIPLKEAPYKIEELEDEKGWISPECAFVSPDGDYLLKYKYGYEWIESARLYDKNGRFIKEINGGEPNFSPDGSFFITVGDGGAGMYFYDRNGNLLNVYEEFIDFYKISSDGRYVVVGKGPVSLGCNKGAISLFDNKGNKLWENNLPSAVYDIAISDDDSYIAVFISNVFTNNNNIILYNRSGDLIWEKKILESGAWRITILNNGQYIEIKDTEKGIYLYENPAWQAEGGAK